MNLLRFQHSCYFTFLDLMCAAPPFPRKTSRSDRWEKWGIPGSLSQGDLKVPKDKCETLRDLVPFVQFKKREKYSWRSVTFTGLKFATLLKVTLLHGCFSPFLNCTNGTKLCHVSNCLWWYYRKNVLWFAVICCLPLLY